MHTPYMLKEGSKEHAEWEEKLKELQVSCLILKRNPPPRLACPDKDCETVFEGANCWDDRMDHFAKHVQRAGIALGRDQMVVKEGCDELLIDWVLKERIIESIPGGGFQNCPQNGLKGHGRR
jgi:hypothetical protein